MELTLANWFLEVWSFTQLSSLVQAVVPGTKQSVQGECKPVSVPCFPHVSRRRSSIPHFKDEHLFMEDVNNYNDQRSYRTSHVKKWVLNNVRFLIFLSIEYGTNPWTNKVVSDVNRQSMLFKFNLSWNEAFVLFLLQRISWKELAQLIVCRGMMDSEGICTYIYVCTLSQQFSWTLRHLNEILSTDLLCHLMLCGKLVKMYGNCDARYNFIKNNLNKLPDS